GPGVVAPGGEEASAAEVHGGQGPRLQSLDGRPTGGRTPGRAAAATRHEVEQGTETHAESPWTGGLFANPSCGPLPEAERGNACWGTVSRSCPPCRPKVSRSHKGRPAVAARGTVGRPCPNFATPGRNTL